MNEPYPPEMELIGRTLAGYTVRERIGSGGMAVVFRAHDEQLDRDVALKILSRHLAEDREYSERFIREARMAAKLDHPNIVPVFASGTAEGYLFIAMQQVQGRTLEAVMQERGPMNSGEALAIARQVAEGLAAAHAIGVIHRDIKPTNIMVDEKGRVRLMDFGLARSTRHRARLTASNIYLGTPEYSSPEQCETDDLDARTDIYSLGVVLYELLTGRTPHVGETPLGLFKKITSEDPPQLTSINRSVPNEVAEWVHSLLKRERDERPSSMDEVLKGVARLESILGAEGIRTVRGRRMATAAGRRAVVAFAIIALTALGVALGILIPRDSSEPPAVPQPGTPVPARVHAVVLDFSVIRGGPDDDWIELGLADLLAKTLKQHEFLEVPLRDDVVQALERGGIDAPPSLDHRKALVEAFSPDLFVTGEIYVIDGTLRVDAAVYRASDQKRMFLLNYQRPMHDLFAIVDAMALDLVDRLRMKGAALLRARVPQLPVQWDVPAKSELKPVLCEKIAARSMPVARRTKVLVVRGDRPSPEFMEAKDLGGRIGNLNIKEGRVVSNTELSRVWFGTQRRMRHGPMRHRRRVMRDILAAYNSGQEEQAMLALTWANAPDAPYSGEMIRALSDGDLIRYICPTCPGTAGKRDEVCSHCGKPYAPRLRFGTVVALIKKMELEKDKPVKPKD